MMEYANVETAWGPVLIYGSSAGLQQTKPLFGTTSKPLTLARQFWPDATHNPKLLPKLQRQLQRYFDGRQVEFDVPIDDSNDSAFQRKVRQSCAKIPWGEFRTYGHLASQSGSPRAARAVGLAMKTNPNPIVVPCHRVLGSDHKLIGFSAPGGINTKRRLLELERVKL